MWRIRLECIIAPRDIGGAATRERSSHWAKRKMINLQTCIFALAWVFLLPHLALAMAGFAEEHSVFHYTEDATLIWTRPGDGCDGTDNYCFRLERKTGGNPFFTGLEGSMDRISVPANSHSSMIFAHREKDNKWIIYDLKFEQFLLETADFQQASDYWKSLGLAIPDFEKDDADNKFLHETFDSRVQRYEMPAFFFGFIFVVYIGIPGLFMLFIFSIVYLFKKIIRRKKTPA